MPEVLHVSATQLDLWDENTGCKRKYGFKYIAKIPTPQNPAAALGVEVQDEQLDPYLLTGRPFNFTKKHSAEIALEISRLLPAPMTPGVELRKRFSMPSPTGRFTYVGEFDLYAPTSSVLPPGLITDPGPPLILDVKTTGDLKWQKTAEQLSKDVQAQLYAMYLMYKYDATTIDLVWAYGRTKGKPRAQRTHLRVHAPQVFEQFQRAEALGQELVTIRHSDIKSVDELPPNPKMCDAYGGCPFRHICNLSPAVHAAAVNKEAIEVNQSTAPWLNNLRQGAPVAPPAPSAPPGFAPPPAPPAAAPPGSIVSAGAEAALPQCAVPGYQFVRRPDSSIAMEPILPPAAQGAPPGVTTFGPGWSGAPPAPPAAPPPVNTTGAAAWGAPPAPPAPQGFAPPMPAQAPTAPQSFGPPVNPPESTLPPAPPVGAASPPPAAAEPAKRTRGPNKPKETGTPALDLDALGIPRPAFAAFLRAWAANVEGGGQ